MCRSPPGGKEMRNCDIDVEKKKHSCNKTQAKNF